MATNSFTLTATAGNDSKTINEPNSNDQWKYIWDGLAGTDSLSFDRLPKSDFTIYKDATGIHVDSVSSASHMIYVTLNNVETLKFSDGSTTVNLSALFDTVAPTLSSASPADEAVAVPLASNLILTFSETVQRGTGNIVLRNAGGTVIETYNAATSANLSVSAAVLTVNPTANLSAGTSYYLELAAGTITDAAGNAYAGTQIYNFTTVSGNNLPTGSVNISGTATQGQQLTASHNLADLDGLGVISYQWKSNGTAIPGATSSTYTLTQAEVGKAITVTASYSDALGTSESKTSGATVAVLNVNDLPTGSVSITGTATQDQQLTASHTLADVDGLGVISYQWKADGTAIPGATASTYTLAQAEVGKAITVTASYGDAQGTPESKTSAATRAVLNINDRPAILGNDTMPSITMGVSNGVATLSVMDVDGDILRLTLRASEGVLFLPVGTVDEDLEQAGLQLSGLAEELNALLKTLHFAPTTTNAALTVEVSDVHGAMGSEVHRFRVDVPTNYNSQDGDADGISSAVELAVPDLRTESNTGLTGDGNGDGVLDFYQVNVSSALLQIAGPSGTDLHTYATLVAGSVLGKSDDASGLVITSVGQGINLQDLPTAMSAPIGKFEFTVNLTSPGNTEHFSIYVDEALAVNGYWKATPEGIWVNLASALYGGQIVTEGGRTRLDFSITDGGVFDDDHAINGQISDPGVVGALTVSLIGSHPHPVIDDFWF